MWYEPGPGFLFFKVSTSGPVTFISYLPEPNPNPLFFEGLNYEKDSYWFGGGDIGALE